MLTVFRHSRFVFDFLLVICGRGSAANNHIGNIRFRDIVKTYQGRYRAACKADKPIVALEIVLSWKGMSPPGRFLSKKKSKSLSTKDMNNNDDGEWYEIPDEQASRKVAQRLRERTTAFDASQFRRLQREGKVVGSTQPPKEVIVVAPLQFKGAEKVSESQPLILESTTTSLDSLLEGISAITTSMGMLKEPEQATSSMFFSNVESDNNENLWGYQQVTEDIAIEENGESLPSAADLLENICF